MRKTIFCHVLFVGMSRYDQLQNTEKGLTKAEEKELEGYILCYYYYFEYSFLIVIIYPDSSEWTCCIKTSLGTSLET